MSWRTNWSPVRYPRPSKGSSTPPSVLTTGWENYDNPHLLEFRRSLPGPCPASLPGHFSCWPRPLRRPKKLSRSIAHINPWEARPSLSQSGLSLLRQTWAIFVGLPQTAKWEASLRIVEALSNRSENYPLTRLLLSVDLRLSETVCHDSCPHWLRLRGQTDRWGSC